MACLVAGVGAAALILGQPWLVRQRDVTRVRALYQSLSSFPGATKVYERSYEIPGGDGGGSGHYWLAVTYRLPATATSQEVFSYLRRNLPFGWSEATDDTCRELAQRLPPPPQATPAPQPSAPATSSPALRDAPVSLIRREGELTFFAPVGDGPRSSRFSGVTFHFFREAQDVLLRLDQPIFGCEPLQGS